MNRFKTINEDERGATAVLVGLLAIVLFAVGAIVVDIGQAYAKRSLLQTNVDLAVLAAAAELTQSDGCNSEVVDKATEFLDSSANKVPGQDAVDLRNGSRDDGYIECSNWTVRLWAPNAHVDFTLGRVVSSSDGTDVHAYAAAQIKSAMGGATLPFFAVQGCDSGPQSIRNPSGPVTTPAPTVLNPSSAQTNNASFTISPASVPTGTTSAQITLTGNNFNGVDHVTFTGLAGPPYHYEVPVTPAATGSTRTITVNVPPEVLAVEDTWWVRVKAGAKYSTTADAQPFTVGSDKLFCDARNEGNFGTIEIPRSDTNNANWLAYNIIKGVEPSLAVHQAPSGQCDGQPGSVVSDHSPVNGTNCVASETGLRVSSTTAGLVTGAGGMPGRLDADSTSNCSRNDDSSRTTATVKGQNINDDLLTCFITNGAHISDLVAGNSVGTEALSAAIFSSPRFFWLPVLKTDPSTGRKYWPITGFVPGFISDQALTATHDAPGTISSLDGIVADSSGVGEVKVVLLSPTALPEFAPARGGETDYTGSGPKAIVLVE